MTCKHYLRAFRCNIDIAEPDGLNLTYFAKMKAYSIAAALALFAASGSFAPAFARPFLYVSGFSYSGSAKKCLKGAQKALKEAGFKRDLETKKYDGDATGGGREGGRDGGHGGTAGSPGTSEKSAESVWTLKVRSA